jgi:hypothetical protein
MTLSDMAGGSAQFRSLRFLSGDRLLATNDNGSVYVFEAGDAAQAADAPGRGDSGPPQ